MTTEMPEWMKEYEERADEPLHPNLEPYVSEVDLFGDPHTKVLKHPYVFQVPLFHAWQANDQYEHKMGALKDAILEGDTGTYIWLHERPYRVVALEQVAAEMDDDDFWELASHVWTDTENHWQERLRWNKMLRADRPGKEHFMDLEERAAFAQLPDVLTVYRGWNGSGSSQGLSWTLDRDRAVWFAKRLAEGRGGQLPTVATGKVDKSDTLGLLLGRGEREIAVPRPARVKIIVTEQV